MHNIGRKEMVKLFEKYCEENCNDCFNIKYKNFEMHKRSEDIEEIGIIIQDYCNIELTDEIIFKVWKYFSKMEGKKWHRVYTEIVAPVFNEVLNIVTKDK